MGCILGELTDTKPLFPGKNHIDQLSLILKAASRDQVVGNLPAPLKALFEQNKALKGEKLREVKSPVGLAARYEGFIKDKHTLDLLQRLLEMDPDRRITARQALDHPYFADCRAKDLALLAGPRPREQKVHALDLLDSVGPAEQPRGDSPQRQAPEAEFRGSLEGAKPKYSRTQDLVSKLQEEARESQGSTAKTYYNGASGLSGLVGPLKGPAKGPAPAAFARGFESEDKAFKYK